MKIDSIIFDLDGTLWDSCRVVWKSWRTSLEERYSYYNAPSLDDVRGIMGLTPQQIADRLFSDFGDRSTEVCVQCIRDENAYIAKHCGDLYPSVVETLARLSEEYPLYIISNCMDGYIQCFLKASGTEKYISGFLSQEDTGLSKGENIALLIKEQKLKAPIYVGDTLSDERSAAEGGCGFIHATYGFGDALAPLAVINTPLELIDIIKKLKEANYNG